MRLGELFVDVVPQLNDGAFTRDMARLSARARRAAGTIDIQVDVDTRHAMTQLNRLQRQLRELDRTRVSPSIGGGGSSALSALSSGAVSATTALLALGPALAPIAAVSLGGIAALGPMLVAAGAGAGVAALAFYGLGDAVKALGVQARNGGKETAALASSQRAAAQNVARARENVARAEVEVARATKAAANGVRDALRTQAEAEKNLAQTQREATDLQEGLTQAREDAQRKLEDYSVNLEEASIREKQAQLDLIEAKAAMDAANRDPGATEHTRKRVALAYQEQLVAIEELRLKNGRLREDAAKAATAGVEGSDEVTAAQDRIAQANQNVIDAQDAQARAAEGVAAAVQAQSDAQVDGAQRVADAQRGVSDALLAQKDVLSQTTASADATAEAMSKLGPAGQAFAVFLAGLAPLLQPLKDAAETGLFTGITDGIKAAMPALPVFEKAIGAISWALGDVVRRFGEWVGSPDGQKFIAWIGEVAPPLLKDMADILGSVGGAAVDLLKAFSPLATILSGWLVKLADKFADWAKDADFSGFIDYFKENGPKIASTFAEVAKAVGDLVVAALPIGGAILDGIKWFAEMIQKIPPKVLTDIIGAIAAVAGIIALISAAGVVAPIIEGIITLVGFIGGTAAAIIAIVAVLVAGFALAWQNSETFRDIVTGAWDAVKGAVETVVDWFTDTAMPALQGAWDTVSKFFEDTWNNVLKPVWDDFSGVVTWIWDTVLSVVFLAVKVAWYVMSNAMKWAWENILKPVWDAITGAAKWLWEKVLSPIFTWIGDHWDDVLRAMKVVYDTILAPVFDAFGTAIDGLHTIFDTAVGLIQTAWDKLKDVAKTPINFVVETVINKGLIGGFNKLANFFHTDPIEEIPWPPPGWANGGYTGHGGKYDPKGIVHAGEYVFTKEQTSRLGVSNLARLAKGGKKNSRGDDIGGWSPIDFLEGVKDAASNVASFVKDPVGNIRKLVENLFAGAGDSQFAKLALNAPKAGLDMAINAIKGFLGGGSSSGGGGGLFGGGSGGGLAGLLGFVHALQAMGARASEHPLFGGVTPGGHMVGSKHYVGRAVDLNYGVTGPGEMAFFDSIVRQGLAAQYGVKTLWRVPGHFNHMHAEYDNGGWLQAGRTMTANNTGKPEAVLTNNQWGNIERLVKAVETNQRPHGPLIGQMVVREQVDAQRVAQELDFRMRRRQV